MNIQNKKFKQVILALSLSFIAFQIFYFFDVKNKKPIDAIPIGIEAILLIIFCFYFFYEQLKKTVSPIYDNFFFWIVLGLIIYLSGSFFIYLLSNTISSKELRSYWNITYIVDILKNVFFVASGLVFLKQSKSATRKPVLPNLDFY